MGSEAQRAEAKGPRPPSSPALPPILSLPDEVLSVIFAFYAEACLTVGVDPQIYPFFPATPPERSTWKVSHSCNAECRLQWIRVMCVCRRWRAIILSDPGLWTTPNFSISDICARKMLRRSRNMPLNVLRLTGSDCRQWRVLGGFQWFARCKELRFSATHISQLEPLLAEMRDQPASSLEVLTIVNRRVGGFETIPAHWMKTATRLKTLGLRGCGLPSWAPAPCFDNLTLLAIDGGSHCQPTLPQLVAILRRTTHIRILLLECLTNIDDQYTASPPCDIVCLPHLMVMSLSGRGSQCFNLWNHLSVPTSASLRFSSRGRDTSSDIIEALPTCLAPHFHSKAIDSSHSSIPNAIYPERTLDLSKCPSFLPWFQPFSPSVQASVSSRKPREHEANFKVEVELDLRWQYVDPLDLSHVIGVIGATVGVTSIKHLNIQDTMFKEQVHWERLWHTFPEAQTLSMATKSTETFRSAESCTAAWVCSLEPHLDLRDRSDARSVLQTADCPLPNLEELSVANIKFSDGGGSSTPSLPPVDITFRLLRRCLAIRRAVCGRRLAKLTFEKCSGHINRDQARVLVEEGSVAIVIFNEV